MVKKVIINILVFILLISVPASAEQVNNNTSKILNLKIINTQKVISNIKFIIRVNREADFIVEKTNLTYEESEFLISECEKKSLNLFLILGLMKVESNFNEKTIGSSGERGLGQLMEGTAKALAKNLNIDFEPEYLFEPKYNILLFATHLNYLKRVYNDDMHKVLTAYNRGQQGLTKYMASRGGRRDSAISTYSNRILEYSEKFSLEYGKYIKTNKKDVY